MDLVSDLRSLGVRPGELLMVHASLRRLGLARRQGVRDGAAQLVAALDEAVGPSGTVLMVLGVDYAHDAVNLEPIDQRARLLEGAAPMDVLTAPVLPEVGAFAEVFRTTPGTRIQRHPSCRFAARGARAEEILEDTPWDDYYGPGSPLDRLCAWGGRVARLGSNPETMTVLHYAEYLADLPEKRTTRWDFVWPEPEGPRHRWVTCLDDANGVADWEGDDYFAEITRRYLELGRHGRGRVGATDAELVEAADFVRFGAAWMTANLAPA